jgi:branched-chain amino acid transport system ATP-binding protein
MPQLEITNLHKNFGGLVAIDSVDLEIKTGETVGIIGPNGAGKTTFFNCISGIIDPDDGDIVLKGEEITHRKSYEIAKKGMVRSFQEARALEEMSVEDNVKLGAQDHPGERIGAVLFDGGTVREHETSVEDRAEEIMEFLDIIHLHDEYASSLSGGQRKLLDLARMLMADPDLFLLDEPFAGVNPALTVNIISHLEELKERGKTLVIVEHEIESLLQIVDRLVVLHNGRILTDGSPSQVIENEDVIEAYLGEEEI